ncbi:MAG TPA: hypothetical protein VLT35_06900 [Methanocella sp.]|nr:hypothetical protein [Methanocella sp.]
MTEGKTAVKKTAIGEYVAEIVRYVESFEVRSAKDEQALSDILSMVKDVSARVNEIEAAHQKRIVLTKELEARLAELESITGEFVKSKA